ncbi:hypothetical protein MKY37_06080 [Psychrobacillus sp. FSL K6-2836]|uniref:hypothetical protein n=1 Tax=Psychrobacillus sp. FSL K6-2836 TaxID=2921548 RepID=UPI0030F5DBCD
MDDVIQELEQNIKTSRQWLDPYDAEKIKNRYLRGSAKRIALFQPNIFYKFNIFEKNVWDENYIMLGQAALNFDRKDLVITCLEKLDIPTKEYWGLPIDWHSGKYIFHKGMLMSTTTSECILFLCEVYNTYPDLIEKKYLMKLAKKILISLNKNIINSGDEYLYSYTPIDKYQVFNSNLLVAAAIGVIGKIVEDCNLIDEAKRIYTTCEKYLPKEGYIPYSIFGSEKTADAYHQLFSMRAVYSLKEYNLVNTVLLERIESYFFEKFYLNGNVVLRPESNTLDLQPFSEALRYFGISKNLMKFKELYESRFSLMKKDRYIQRVWRYNSKIKIKSNVCHSRQGYLRLLLALSYKARL